MTDSVAEDLLQQADEATFLRMQAHVVRVQIELIAAQAYGQVAQLAAIRQNQITARLAVLLVSTEPGWFAEAHPVVVLARHTYRRACDVLHGRSTMLGLNRQTLTEWEVTVDRLDSLYKRWMAIEASAPDGPP